MAHMAIILKPSSMIFCLLLTFSTLEDFHATAMRDGSFNWKNFNSSNFSSASGLCASSVVIHGYKCLEFRVTTRDGYILSLQKISKARLKNVEDKNKPPVILQHGVLVDGTTWLLTRPHENLPFILANNGFDVWISNGRGTKFSRKHVNLSTYDSKYWDWTWDELARYDIPAVVNFVNRQTREKVHYVGHSQGTLTALIALSEGRIVDKLKSATLLSPIAYLDHITTQLAAVAARTFLDLLYNFFSIPMFDPLGGPVRQMMEFLCIQPVIDCFDILAALTGNNCCLNQNIINAFLQNGPQPTSVKNMIHFARMIRKGVLAKFDYGLPVDNLRHYGQFTPPLYNLSEIPRNFPLFLTYGGRDALSDAQDVKQLLVDLKFHDVQKLKVQHIRGYAHLDFIMGVNAYKIVYGEVIKFLRRW